MATINFPNGPNYADLIRTRSVISDGGGPAKSNRFLVNIPKPIDGLNGFQKDLTLLCEAAEFPGRGLFTVDNRYYGPNFKIPYQTTYEDLTLTFLVRDKFLERQYFDGWMNAINPIDSYNFNYRADYTTNIELFQLSDIGTPVRNTVNGVSVPSGETFVKTQYAFTFEKAYPVLVNPQPVTWADDNFHRLSVTFTYTRWYRRGLDKYTTSGVGSELALPEVQPATIVNNNGTTSPTNGTGSLDWYGEAMRRGAMNSNPTQ